MAAQGGTGSARMALGHFLASRALPGIAAACIVGLGTGAARVLGGSFSIGIQGMLAGGLIGWLAGRSLRRDTFDEWPLGLRFAWALGLTGVFWVGQMLGADVASGTLTPGTWVLRVWSDGEVMLGHRRYSTTAHVWRSGPMAWVGFNMLDALLQWMLTLVTLTTSLTTRPAPGHVHHDAPAGASLWLLLLPGLLVGAYGGAALLAHPAKRAMDWAVPMSTKPMTPEAIQQMEGEIQRLQAQGEACDKLPDAVDRIRCRDALLQKMGAASSPGR